MTISSESLNLVSAPVHATGMKGFDAEFQNLNQYIRVSTDRIWEGGRIEDICLYYSDPCVVETCASVSTSIEDIISGTHATMAMFPDSRILTEDIIQSGDENGGFLSSHRIISTMTHLGQGSFGPPKGRKMHTRTVDECVCINNRIVHEWMVRDHASLALQMGPTPQALAQRWLNERGGWTKPVAGPAPAGFVSHISTDPLAVRYAQGISDMAHGKESGRAKTDAIVASLYDDAARQIGPGESSSFVHAEVAGFWHSVFGALQVQQFDIEHLTVQRDMLETGRCDRIALRFRAKTIHNLRTSESLRYGKPTNRPVEVMGIVHAEFVQGRVIREWVLINDVAIWMQILTPQA